MYILQNVSLGRIHKKQLIYKNELKILLQIWFV